MSNVFLIFGFGWKYLRRYWVRLAIGVFFGVIFGVANANFIWATKTLTERFSPRETEVVQETPVRKAPVHPAFFTDHINRLKESVDRAVDPWLPRARQPLNWRQILGALLFLPLLVSVRSLADYLNNYCMGWVSERTVRDVRLDVMEKLSTLSLDFFTRSTTGDLLTRINADTANLQRSFRGGAADLVKETVTIIAVFLGLCWLDLKLTLWTMGLLPFCLFPLYVLGRKARGAMRRTMRASGGQSAQLVELLTGIRIIKAFNLEAEEIARFRRTSNEIVRAGMKGIQAKEQVNPLIEAVSTLGISGLLLYVFGTGRSSSDLAAFLAGVLFFFLALKRMANLHIIFEQAGVAVYRLLEIFNEKPRVVEPATPKPMAEFKSSIVFDHVHFAYQQSEVVREFSYTIPYGFKVGIAGESGSGKTTLINLLLRFYDPTRGTIKIDGLDLREISSRALREQMALVSQDVVLFDQTVAENIGCGKPGANREEIIRAARAAFAHDFIMQLPEGYDTRTGERGVTLSGGQRQRIAIARAFVRNAPILVLDEATASLDSKAEAEVQAAIDRLAEHRTVICVAHRLSTLAGMDQILVFSEGRLIETGGFGELLRKNGMFAEMCRRQGIMNSPPR